MAAGISAARLRTIFALFAVLVVLLSVRVVYWQTVGRGDLLAQATGQVRSDEVVQARRGTIRDRSGAVQDPCGNEWWIATHVEDVTKEKMARRAKEAYSKQK